jgi:SAM-dependent methyltransferase
VVPKICDMDNRSDELQAGYDRVAEHYAQEYSAELARKPFDREMLDHFADHVKDKGVVCELGCGPGQVARYLKDRGVDVRGIDLSAQMVAVASNLNPDIPFSQGDMLALNLPDNSLAGIVLFYSIIHIERADVTRALREMGRLLEPRGELLMAFHAGEGELHRDEWFGQPVSIDFRLFEATEMAGYLQAAGFENIETITREPYEFEYPTTRVYISASTAN